MPILTGTMTVPATLLTSRARSILFSGAFRVGVTDDELVSLNDQLQMQRNSGNLTGYAMTVDPVALLVGPKYLLALESPNVHMLINKQGLDALTALPGGTVQGTVNLRVNTLKAAWNAHLSNVGSYSADGQHKATDAAHAVATADATNLATCITLINDLLAAIIAHGDETGIHFSDDTGAGGTGATITVDPPVTLANCVTDANDLLTAMQTHMGLGNV
jgi:hypothetical protein